jgi:hypothetical protein
MDEEHVMHWVWLIAAAIIGAGILGLVRDTRAPRERAEDEAPWTKP